MNFKEVGLSVLMKKEPINHEPQTGQKTRRPELLNHSLINKGFSKNRRLYFKC